MDFENLVEGFFYTVESVLELLSIHHFIRELKGLKYCACKYAAGFCCITFVLCNCSISLDPFILETF